MNHRLTGDFYGAELEAEDGGGGRPGRGDNRVDGDATDTGFGGAGELAEQPVGEARTSMSIWFGAALTVNTVCRAGRCRAVLGVAVLALHDGC